MLFREVTAAYPEQYMKHVSLFVTKMQIFVTLKPVIYIVTRRLKYFFLVTRNTPFAAHLILCVHMYT